MRRALLLGLLTVVLVGCSESVPGSNKITTPTPVTVIGKVATGPVGNAANGKAIFVGNGCGACHTFTPAGPGAAGKVGPDLNTLMAEATKANQGSLEQFTMSSIVNPAAYIAPGYQAGVMPATYGQSLKPQQLADLVAFLVKGP